MVGAGILGTAFAYWASRVCEASIVVLEQEPEVGLHTTLRNTGVLHRPFYLNPVKKRIFARAAQLSYENFWRSYAEEKKLPWKQIGTFEVAVSEEDMKTLHNYMRWGLANGMEEAEVELLDRRDVQRVEPHVKCLAAVFCKTDTAVDFRLFAEALRHDAEAFGVKFLMDSRVEEVKFRDGRLNIHVRDRGEPLQVDYLVNCAGGSSLDVAHMMGLGLDYTDLHFRGEYWVVEPSFGESIKHNIYSVPYVKDYPFLDPHFVIRWDGLKEIGPNAVLVAGPQTYHGLAGSPVELFGKIVERPLINKLRLFVDRKFITLVSREWRSSISKREMCRRVQQFIPELKISHLRRRGVPGVRSSVIGRTGFIPEAVELRNDYSCHIINFNSPGATGAPAYSAYILGRLIRDGLLPLNTSNRSEVTRFEDITSGFN